ncbi:tetranectin-like protein [Drosophila sulfurigaster albostrigata]|uniref:tetranectin-like protein n=1 Tax=Drosophila sulfurigaster albostrigata TaxID=89887 RepID=UPI002D21B6D7|nr:tetranectin-like protein [Drosophila sulfurigaster albostrigata]
MNIRSVFFVLLVSMFILFGDAENCCSELNYLQSLCGNYCLEAIKPALNKMQDLQSELDDLKNESRNSFTEFGKLIDLQNGNFANFRNVTETNKYVEQQLQIATERIQQQLQKQDVKFQQMLKNLEEQKALAPFQKIGSKYYYIEESEEVNWFGALNKCRAIGGHLVSFENLNELNAVKRKLQTGKDYWIGIYDLADEGQFISVATGKMPTYFDWTSGEPNNLGGVEDCGELNSYYEYKMNDDTCTIKQLFICEFRN